MPLMQCITRRPAVGQWRLSQIITAKEQSPSSCATMVPGSPRQPVIGFSSNSSPQRKKASEWALPSCALSSTHMAEALQPKMPMEAARVFIFVCQLRKECHNDEFNRHGVRDR